MATKRTIHYVCSECGHSEAKWAGRCPSCGTWNTMQEFRESSARDVRSAGRSSVRGGVRTGRARAEGGGIGGTGSGGSLQGRGAGGQDVSIPGSAPAGHPAGHPTAQSLHELEAGEGIRFSTGHPEFDRVLGGGLIHGSTVLLGGEPGIGKSTLMLQTAALVDCRVLYLAGEESPRQIKNRADRLGIGDRSVRLSTETTLSELLAVMDAEQPELLIIDSIQTLWDEETASPPGAPTQLRRCAFAVSEWCRLHEATAVFIAHVTKEGTIAGPKILEHMVDAVLYFEQSEHDLRFLRVPKNRFGTTDEIGLFSMGADGLTSVSDPTGLFFVQREDPLPAGITTTPVYEGSRVLMVEIQALTVPAAGGSARTYSDRIDPRRVSRIAAVLEKHLGLRFSDQDIYINVAGGIRISEVAVDLALAVALYSARTGVPCPAHTTCTGEISLAGEVRPVVHLTKRLTAAKDLGITTCVGPATARRGEQVDQSYQRVHTLGQAIRELLKK
ncbi:MAG: DNA repair protein RadA [Spirochaeta sp.]